MDSFSTKMESGVESELLDLGAVSMMVLRALDHAVLHRALWHVVEQTDYVRITAEHSGVMID